jgi:hypothetical protein
MPRCYTEAFGKTLLRNAKAFCEKLVLFNVHRFVEGYVKELGLEDVENYDKNQYGFIKQVAEESS